MIHSREGLDTSPKISRQGPTQYTPLELSDASVFHLSKHYYTLQEIADTFHVDPQTVTQLHGRAYYAGKQEASQKPRMLMDRFFQEWMDKKNLHDTDIIPLGDGKYKVVTPDYAALAKMLEIYAKKYEGYGSKQTIVHEDGGKSKYDAVEDGAPRIVERPNHKTEADE